MTPSVLHRTRLRSSFASAVPFVWLLVALSVACGGDRSAQGASGRLPAPPPGVTATLEGRVSYNGTQFVVENVGEAMWKDVEVAVYPDLATGFVAKNDAILGQRSVTIGALHFESPAGARFSPFRVVPRMFRILATLPDGGRGFVSGTIREVKPDY